ncbi:MAG: Nucleoside ABC transporter, permease protein 2, partial [uncultured Nocardioidaceae bacterium]
EHHGNSDRGSGDPADPDPRTLRRAPPDPARRHVRDRDGAVHLLRPGGRRPERALHPRRAGHQGVPAQGPQRQLGRVAGGGRLSGRAGARCGQPLPARGCGCRAGRPRRADVLPRLPDVGVRRPGRGVHRGDHEPDPRHDPDRHPAGPGGAGRCALRARGRHQHRDRGAVPRRRVLRRDRRQPGLPALHRPARGNPRRGRHRGTARRLRAALPGQPGRARGGPRRARVRADELPARPDPRGPRRQAVLQRAAHAAAAADPGTGRHPGRRRRALRPDGAGLPHVPLGRARDLPALPDPVGAAGPLRGGAPQGRGHRGHQGQPHPVAGGPAGRCLRRARRRLLHRRLDRRLRPRRLRGHRLHRARRGHHGALAPAGRHRRRGVLRLHAQPADPDQLRRQAPQRAARRRALPRDDHRRRRLRRPGPAAGRGRRALREEL